MSPTSAQEAELYPAFLKLTGRKVVIVGDGPLASAKASALLAAGARVVVIAPDIFTAADLDDAWFVVAAAAPDMNRAVAAAAEERRLFVNAVDDPVNATAYLGGVLRRSGVTVAISTAGEAPGLAGLLREALEVVLPDDLDRWLKVARAQRRGWKAQGVPMSSRRPLLLEALNSLYGPSGSREAAP